MHEVIEDQSLVSSDGSLAGVRGTSQTLPDAEFRVIGGTRQG